MKKTILTFSILVAVTGAAALAMAMKPLDYRRTLFVPVGQDTLTFEAPKGMCFFDSTRYLESSVSKLMSDLERKKGAGVFLGAFAPCNGIANFGNGEEGLVSAGSIVWLNPSIGEKTPLERSDYLDMREATYKEYVQEMAEKESAMLDNMGGMKDGAVSIVPNRTDGEYDFDGTIHRTADGVSFGYLHDPDAEGRKPRNINVAATTSIRHYPIEVTLFFVEKDDASMEKVHELMDKFITQQIALNE